MDCILLRALLYEMTEPNREKEDLTISHIFIAVRQLATYITFPLHTPTQIPPSNSREDLAALFKSH